MCVETMRDHSRAVFYHILMCWMYLLSKSTAFIYVQYCISAYMFIVVLSLSIAFHISIDYREKYPIIPKPSLYNYLLIIHTHRKQQYEEYTGFNVK